jgi:hypothetical protein
MAVICPHRGGSVEAQITMRSQANLAPHLECAAESEETPTHSRAFHAISDRDCACSAVRVDRDHRAPF